MVDVSVKMIHPPKETKQKTKQKTKQNKTKQKKTKTKTKKRENINNNDLQTKQIHRPKSKLPPGKRFFIIICIKRVISNKCKYILLDLNLRSALYALFLDWGTTKL